MADHDDGDDSNVVNLSERQKEMAAKFDRGESKKRKRKKKDEAEKPPIRRPPPPDYLPHDSPVRCLGHQGLLYHFLDAVDQVISLVAKEIGRLNLIALFGGDKYLLGWWPRYDSEGGFTGDWRHGLLAPILIKTCQAKGLWNPRDKLRDVGCWIEEDGTLVFHCGDILVTSKGRFGPGQRESFVYPRGPKVPEPITDMTVPGSDGARYATAQWGPDEWRLVGGPGAAVMERLVTWKFARPFIDPILILGDICCALLGAAPGWRPMMLVTGESRTGKSTLLGGLKAIIGTDAFISSGNATQAAIARLVGSTTKPVFLDEMERNYQSTRADELIELLILASSGETLDRGTPGAETNSFVARNCFVLSAINLPGLKQQVLNRVFVIELATLDPNAPQRVAEKDKAKDQVEEVWGPRPFLERIGRELRGRLLQQWPRYIETLHLYRRSLLARGHDRRSADQFGSALTAYDLVMFDAPNEQRCDQLASWLIASRTAEISDSVSLQQQFVNWLVQLKVSIGARGGRQVTIAKLLHQARADLEMSILEEKSEARTALMQIGIRTFRRASEDGVETANKPSRWTIAIATDHAGLAELLVNTPWHMKAGATSGWTDMLRRLPGAELVNPLTGTRRRIRIDGRLTYTVFIPWESMFGNANDTGDEDVMQFRDRL